VRLKIELPTETVCDCDVPWFVLLLVPLLTLELVLLLWLREVESEDEIVWLELAPSDEVTL